jgi:hypothetical protein
MKSNPNSIRSLVAATLALAALAGCATTPLLPPSEQELRAMIRSDERVRAAVGEIDQIEPMRVTEEGTTNLLRFWDPRHLRQRQIFKVTGDKGSATVEAQTEISKKLNTTEIDLLP